jgi:hypothetical protein
VARVRRQTFNHLTEGERAIVGDPDDYAWADAVKVSRRPGADTTQFSLRVDVSQMRALEGLAKSRGVTFSEVVRDAISRYLTGTTARVELYDVTSAGISVYNAPDAFAGAAAHWPEAEAIASKEHATIGELILSVTA